MALDNGIAGSPATVRDFIAAEIAATGSNYLLSWLAFGDMTLAEIADARSNCCRAR